IDAATPAVFTRVIGRRTRRIKERPETSEQRQTNRRPRRKKIGKRKSRKERQGRRSSARCDKGNIGRELDLLCRRRQVIGDDIWLKLERSRRSCRLRQR